VGLICLVADAPLIVALLSTSPSPIVLSSLLPTVDPGKGPVRGRKRIAHDRYPWATAWYGRRQSIWLTLKHKDASAQRLRNNFYEVNSFETGQGALSLRQDLKSIETRSLEQWLRGDDDSAIFSRFRQRLLAGSKAQDQGMGDAELMAAFRSG